MSEQKLPGNLPYISLRNNYSIFANSVALNSVGHGLNDVFRVEAASTASSYQYGVAISFCIHHYWL